LACLILVIGAARSGKSEWAEYLAKEINRQTIYVATSIEGDREWQERIKLHQQRRPPHWQTLVVPVELSQVLAMSHSSNCLLIDSLGIWVANCLDRDLSSWESTVTNFLTTLQSVEGKVILVGEETGWGVIPAYESGRLFRDRLGSLLRQIGSIVDRVDLVVGGHVIDLSTLGKRLPN
jgi:adenosylcobinamide kinase/adenosylcobinamide-phosphate guanylyltransferase